MITQIQCESCLGSLSLKNATSFIVSCPYCGTEHVIVDEAKLLTKNNERTLAFKLSKFINENFDLEGVKDLTYDLSATIDSVHLLRYDNLSGQTLNAKPRELAQWCYRHGELPDLFKLICKKRPKAVLKFGDWD